MGRGLVSTDSANRTSLQVTHLRSSYPCTVGLLMLGTPHYGSFKGRLLYIVTKLASFAIPSAALSLSTTLPQILGSGTDVHKEIMPRFRVFIFWEVGTAQY